MTRMLKNIILELEIRYLYCYPLQNHPRYFGPYSVAKKVNKVDYIINTPDRQKTKHLCHVNMMKPYPVCRKIRE